VKNNREEGAMRRLGQLLLIACIATSVQGCGIFQRVKFSQATVSDDASKMTDNGFFDLEELFIAVTPQNRRDGPAFFTLVLPIIPLQFGYSEYDSTYPREVSVIQIFLVPKNKQTETAIGLRGLCPECRINDSVFTLDPARITLRTDDGKSHNPVAYSGSHLHGDARYPWRYPNSTTPAERFPHVGSGAYRNVMWHYCEAQKSRKLHFEEPKGAVEFSDRACFVLWFNVPQLDPDQGFVLSLGDAIKKGGVDIPIPAIRFEMGTVWEFD
jgi:hypothetical protein